ncbi:MAG: hypothetical protein IID43_06320 [Planctomycetes bacterium]|nr:hypothetical protein [Planctomycetota bacterium]
MKRERVRILLTWLFAPLLTVLVVGCQTGGLAEKYGKTFYLDGAGNWGDGGTSVAHGLLAAGYQGDVEEYVWTTSFNPLVDQLNVVAARIRSGALARKIASYRKRFPNNNVNLVALSAGTGVATWAVEQLDPSSKIENLILLGSSLSYDYDMTKALSNMTGNIYVYCSPHDSVLESVRKIGTIDGKRGVQSAGLVGLDVPPGARGRVKNIGWSERYIDLGWTGAHTDCTSKPFVRRIIARHVQGKRRARRIAAAAQYSLAPMLTSYPSR